MSSTEGTESMDSSRDDSVDGRRRSLTRQAGFESPEIKTVQMIPEQDTIDKYDISIMGKQDCFEKDDILMMGKQDCFEKEDLKMMGKQDCFEKEDLKMMGKQDCFEKEDLKMMGKQDCFEKEDLKMMGKNQEIDMDGISIPKQGSVEKRVHFSPSSVQDKIHMFESFHEEDSFSEQIPVRRTVSDSAQMSGRSRKEVHLRVRSVTFAEAVEDDDNKPRLCRTPTPFWPRSDSVASDAGCYEGKGAEESIDLGDNVPTEMDTSVTAVKSGVCVTQSNLL